jgi:hypothetical protein
VKKIIKTFTFWFALIGVVVVILNILKLDDMNILMIGLNPILNLLSSSSIDISSIPYLWHILSLVTMAAYGLALDGAIYLIKILKNK